MLRSRTVRMLAVLLIAVCCLGAGEPDSSQASRRGDTRRERQRERQPPRRDPSPTYPDNAVAGMTPAQVEQFLDGQTAFNEVEEAADGLGPIFNDSSCAACHANGGGSTRISAIIGLAGRLQFAAGGPVIQLQALPGFRPEVIPSNVRVGQRRAMTTQGLGLVGGILDQDLLTLQAMQASATPLIAGRANIVIDAVTGERRVGRIGQKSQHPNATSFAAEAYLREMGITTPFFPTEEAPFNNPALLAGNPRPDINDDGEDVFAFGFFMDHLKPPEGVAIGFQQPADMQAGLRLFTSVGCSVCHQPTWVTRSSADASLSRIKFSPYSDFLLHDMGASGDQIQQGMDSTGQPIPGSWMRTTPLWGVGRQKAWWHDASADSILAAINRHSGQGQGAKTLFNALTPAQQRQLLAFVSSL